MLSASSDAPESSSSSDVYVHQLKEIFVSCDSSGSGRLNPSDLSLLCSRLTLDSDISRRIIDSLLAARPADESVSFDQFKEAFINILTEVDETENVADAGLTVEDQMENALDLSSEEKHLRDIWREIGVGVNGYLTLDELSHVCQYLNMGHMTNKDLEQLFDQLDVNRDGLVSFGELLHGLFATGDEKHPAVAAAAASLPPQRTPSHRPMLSVPPNRSSDRLQQPFQSIRSQSIRSLHGQDGIRTFLNRNNSGFATSEEIVALWETLGISEGRLVLELLRLDVRRPIDLAKLSLDLVEEVNELDVEANLILQTAISTMLHALDQLHLTVEDLLLERDKLTSDLKEMRNKNFDLLKEIDDLCVSAESEKIESIQNAEKKSQAKYQELLSNAQLESDTKCQLLLKKNDELQVEMDDVRGKLIKANTAKEGLEKEMFDMAEKLSLLETDAERLQGQHEQAILSLRRQVNELQTELSVATSNQNSLAVDAVALGKLKCENKELKDKLDEQSAKIADLGKQLDGAKRRPKLSSSWQPPSSSSSSVDQRLTAADDNNGFQGEEMVRRVRERYEKEMRQIQRGISVERKDIEGAFRLEIAEIEERHLEEIRELKKKKVPTATLR